MASLEQPKIKLYWLNASRAQRILWLLEELNLTYELVVFHRDKDMFAPPELAKIHPLGKSPLVSIAAPGSTEELVLAESSFIVQYLCDHFAQGTNLVPKRYRPGHEGKVGGETEEWLRYQYFLNFSEGSLMPNMLISLVLSIFKGDKVPRVIRPVTGFVANKITAAFLDPSVKGQLAFLESQLATSPGGGNYLCGQHLTAADILISYPLLAARGRFAQLVVDGKKLSDAYPKLWAYVNRLTAEAAYKKAEDKIEEITGEKESLLPH